MISLNEKTVLITGGSSEIGASIAEEFAKRRYRVVLTYYSNEKNTNIVAEDLRKKYGVEVLVFWCDLKEEKSIQDVLTVLSDQKIKIDVLVNNAAVCYDCLYTEKKKDKFMETLEVNVVGTFLMSRILGDRMYEQQEGSIINISSTNGMNEYFPMSIDYDASKAAIFSLTNNLAVAYSPYVRVNAVAPGFIGTKKELADLDEEFLESEKDKIFLHRFGQASEVAKTVFFLASEDASYINNTVIKVDGGMR